MPTDWRAAIYEQFRRELFLTAFTVLRRADEAEDAIHQAFTRLVRLERPPTDPKLYVFRAVRNAALDLAKTAARRREESIHDWDAPAGAAETLDPDSARGVREAIARLDEASRTVVEMHLQAGLTFQETADILGEPLPTVSSRYRRALERLGKELKVHYE
jgi:RNA polymerase sigma-70 factor (ECF subfamily)